ncbi:MAG: hypothetical protein IMY72_05280 [Bacteroidetes bacterium]|nr:hypothetical protein [Bacteroidota bacterium]
MNKLINILVSIVFLISVIVVNINKYYSHGKLRLAVFQETESCCSYMEHYEMANISDTCEHHTQDDCSCENKTETFKISDIFMSKKQI